jgi:hypothetical protein
VPRALATVQTPGSFADEEYYGINASVFVNNKGHAGVMPDGGSYNSKIRRAQQDQP